jgi:rRNA-processing protein FCF1
VELATVVPTGHPIAELLKQLRQIKSDLGNISGGNQEALSAYQRWSIGAAQMLGFYIDREQVERLILTKRHWMLLDMTGNNLNNWLISDSIDAERNDRVRLFDEEIKKLEAIERTWASVQSRLIAPDTNVYLHHEQYFDEVDWATLTGSPDVRLLIPMQVVRELDKTKRAGKAITVSETNTEPLRTRARVSSRRLRKLFADPRAIATLSPGVTAELLLDPLGHRPIDDPDSEIIDRVLTARRLIGRQVAVVTGDGNMQFAVSVPELDVVPLPE